MAVRRSDGYIRCTCQLYRPRHPWGQGDDKPCAKKIGVGVKDIYWTLGSHDVVAIFEAPDDESASALALSVGSRGKVRSETLRAFSFDEMKRVLGKMV